ncbi:hypothetical protein K5E37_29235, partial [Pseudomonas sp. RIT778]|uniref:hypothetical protein n=1 Tax=Pseudomonas sp. RIT778 TaxID=2870471 RepID=UPI001C884917
AWASPANAVQARAVVSRNGRIFMMDSGATEIEFGLLQAKPAALGVSLGLRVCGSVEFLTAALSDG